MHISLYDCGLFPLNKIIPSIIQKLDWKNSFISILTQNEEMVYDVDKFLWTFTPLLFIPHATIYDNTEIQKHSPIIIAHQQEIITSLHRQKQWHSIAINCIPADVSDILKAKENTEDHIVFVLNSESAVTDNFDDLKKNMIETLKNMTYPFRWWIFDNNNWSLKSE
ncbi:MAG: hypothetical protein C0432_05155 [Candidatus Puniceispirillum sp.]|nr:hypothetical protein [Candidatus Pelagibacter sp.]MBA4283663.1 hypothetical protein [Candidatus Puniceispirillum sp.]